MTNFIATIKASSKYSAVSREIRTQYGTLDFPLSHDYSVQQWRNDPEVNRDQIRFLKQRTAIPFTLVDTLSTLEDRSLRVEVLFERRSGFGLSAAWLLNGVVLSLGSEPSWDTSSLPVEVQQLTDLGEIVGQAADLPHSSKPEHALDHEAWLTESGGSIKTGRDLLDRCVGRFPRIGIGQDACDHIRALTGNEEYFDWLLRCFAIADREVATWSNGAFPHSRLPGPATGESRPVKESERLMDLRKFRLPSGKISQFEFHMKSRGSNIRVYYQVDVDSRRVVIGAVIPHLESARY